jgi:O-antigen/teichoic acid export membrane protein
LNKVILNIVWLFLDKIVRLLISLLIFGKLATHVGADNFGILNYSLALTALFLPFISLGLDNIVIQHLAKPDESQSKILASTFYTKLILSVLAFLVCIIFGSISYDIHSINFASICIISLSLLFSPFDVVEIYYQSKIQSRIPALGRLVVFILATTIKIYFISKDKPLIWFIWITSAELIFNFLVLGGIFLKSKGVDFLLISNFSLSKVKEMVAKSWPLLISAISVSIYMKIDQLMLGNVSIKELGYYSAAIKLSEIWNVIPMILAPSLYPLMIEAHQTGNFKNFDFKTQTLFDLLIIISLLIMVFVTIFAPYIIHFLYDSSYNTSILTLQIHIWSTIFVFIGTAYSYVLLIKDKMIITLQSTVLGSVLNILLNFILLPKYGAIGAAIATLVSYGFVICYIIIKSGLGLYVFNFFTFRSRLSVLLSGLSRFRF